MQQKEGKNPRAHGLKESGMSYRQGGKSFCRREATGKKKKKDGHGKKRGVGFTYF